MWRRNTEEWRQQKRRWKMPLRMDQTQSAPHSPSLRRVPSDGAIPMADKDDVVDDQEASGEAERQFGTTPRTAWQEWEAFCEHVETGKAAPSCVIDFAYTDGGNLRGPETQLERCICFHDPDEIVTVVHVHEANVRMAQGALPPQRGREDSLRSLFTWRGLRPSSQMKSFVQDRVEQVKCAGATVSPIAGATSRDLTSIEAAITAEEAFPGALG